MGAKRKKNSIRHREKREDTNELLRYFKEKNKQI